MFWDLQKKYSSLPIGDKIAWEAANNPIPGECEGYLPCYIIALGRTDGEYLSLYPQGMHSEEALKNISENLNEFLEDLKKSDQTYTFPNDLETRKDLQDSLSELKKYLSKLPSAKTSTVLKNIDFLAQKFR